MAVDMLHKVMLAALKIERSQVQRHFFFFPLTWFLAVSPLRYIVISMFTASSSRRLFLYIHAAIVQIYSQSIRVYALVPVPPLPPLRVDYT